MAFDSIGYDGTINEREWAELAAHIGAAEYGVKDADDLKVKAVAGQPMMVSVNSGTAWGRGVMDSTSSNTTVVCDNISSGSRWDLIALRRDWQPDAGGPSEIVAVKGSSSKSIPSARKRTPGVQDDQPLALVRWTAGSSQPTSIIDLRVWAGNGGAVAKDDMVLTYLNHPGASILIDGNQWNCVVGDNDTVSWEKTTETGKIPLLDWGNALYGGTPRSGTNFIVQAGTRVATTDGSGYSKLTFPTPFPHGLLSVTAMNGDDWSTGGMTWFSSSGDTGRHSDAAYGDRKGWYYAMLSQNENTKIISRDSSHRKIHRINWVAIGW